MRNAIVMCALIAGMLEGAAATDSTTSAVTATGHHDRSDRCVDHDATAIDDQQHDDNDSSCR